MLVRHIQADELMSETGVRAGIDHRPGKRLFDIVVSGLALLVLAPLLLTVVRPSG